MADPLIGTAFQIERAALIREIARNISGLPTGPGSAKPAPPAGPATGPNGVSVPVDGLPQDAPVLPEDALPRTPLPGGTALLLGLRPPDPALAQGGQTTAPPHPLALLDPKLAALFATDGNAADATLSNAAPAAGAGATGADDAADAIVALLNAFPASEDGAATTFAFPSVLADPAAMADGEAVMRDRQPAGDGTTPARVSETAPHASRAADETGHAAAPGTRPAIADDRLAGTPAARAMAARDATESVVTRALMSLAETDGAALPRAMQAELGGIIASFILNAHFQPGWPPLRPIVDPEAKALVAQLATDTTLGKDDIAMLTYLANFGLNRKQLLRILKLVASATNRSRLLELLAELCSTLSAVLGTVREELEALVEEWRERQASKGQRERLSLR